MAFNDLHILRNSFKNASRVIKETTSLARFGLVDTVFIAAVYERGLPVDEVRADRVVVHRFRLWSQRLPKSKLVQAIRDFEYAWRVTFYYWRRRVGLVNVHGLEQLPLGVFLKFLYRARLVYDTHELETEKSGLDHWGRRLGKALERRLIRRVDMTLVVSDSIAQWYQEAYGIPRPPVIMNAPRFRKPGKSNIFRDTLDIRDDQTLFLYQGGLMAGRGILLLLEAFQKRQRDDAVIVFMGYGKLADEVKAVADGCDTVFFHPAVEPEVVLDYTSSADIGISFIENVCLSYYYCMPNKLFEYAMAGLPIVISNMVDMRAFVERYGFGVVAADESVAALNAAVDRIMNEDLDLLGENALRAARDNSWERQEEKMLAAYRGLLGVS